MSQKINPISFRLGLFQVWNNTFQVYGKNFYSYRQLLFLKSYIENYLIIKTTFKSSLFLNSISWFANLNTIILLVDYASIHKYNFKIINPEKIEYFLENFKVKFYTIKNLTWLNSANLVSSYILFTFNSTDSFKSGLKYLLIFLNLHLGTKKVFYTAQGIVILKLRGFKIKISGCFDNTRGQMSKSLKYTRGSLSLLKLNNYVEYSYAPIYTKSGVNGFHIWLFYTN